MTHKEARHYRWSFLCLFPAWLIAFIVTVEAWRVLLALMVVYVLTGR